MFEPTGVPEDLKEMIKELVAYESIEKLTEEELEWLRKELRIEIPQHSSIDDINQESWKIEIEL